jgi:hypothetical protein
MDCQVRFPRMAALTRSCYTNADPNKFRVCGLIGYLRWLVKLVVEWSFRHETMPHWVGDPVGRYSSLPDISRRVCHARRWQRRGHGTCKSARSNWNQKSPHRSIPYTRPCQFYSKQIDEQIVLAIRLYGSLCRFECDTRDRCRTEPRLVSCASNDGAGILRIRA